jgi:hypothetical protein
LPAVEKDDSITFRISSELKRALEAAAAADHRSVGQFCTLVLMRHLEGLGEWPPRGAAANRAGAGRPRGRAKRT